MFDIPDSAHRGINSSAEPLPITPAQGDLPSTSEGVVLWHRRHLRTVDHPALAYAGANYETILPLFIFDPAFYGTDGLACDGRLEFLHESLADLSRQYESVEGALSFGHGDPTHLLARFREAGWDIVATADPTGRYGWERDNTVAETCDVRFIDGDGLVRNTEDAREGWSDALEAWFEADQYTWAPAEATFVSVPTAVTIDHVERAYAVDSAKTAVPHGGREAGLNRLLQFRNAIDSYPGSISAPKDARSGTSGLSPYLRFGCLSVREVYQDIHKHIGDGRATRMFISRLYWNRHYNQKLEAWPGWMDRAVNPAMEDFHRDSGDPSLIAAWKAGKTGYPMVDASMRCLERTGWLNFRMRAMCASFLCDLCQQPWKIGADWFYYHLIDADPAINYTQFQTQAGVVGVNMMRIYNPRKQVRDNDPEGAFITRWVPELRSLPQVHLAQPEKTPLHIQRECDVEIGETYPYPVVEYEAARARILSKLEAIKPAAEEALTHPEVKRRASLSRRGRSRGDTGTGDNPSHDESETGSQSSLSFFADE